MTNDKGRVTVPAVLLLAALLVLPVAAVHRRGMNPAIAAAYALLISAISYISYALDKRRAIQGAWRVPEFSLHLSELLGGWPGAFLAQRRLRHKISKISYQIVYWLIVLVYQFAALDSMQHWKYIQAAWSAVRK